MAPEILFSGSAIATVGDDGRTRLPAFVLRPLRRRRGARRLMFGAHEADPCVSGYDEEYQASLYSELERRRLREEERGVAASAHHSRARRLFGSAEPAEFDEAGRIVLPPAIRRRGGIGGFALFVGTGASFEIWDPEAARRSSDGELRALAQSVVPNGAPIDEKETS